MFAPFPKTRKTQGLRAGCFGQRKGIGQRFLDRLTAANPQSASDVSPTPRSLDSLDVVLANDAVALVIRNFDGAVECAESPANSSTSPWETVSDGSTFTRYGRLV